MYGLPDNLAQVPAADVPDGVTWAETAAGVKIPVPLTTLRPEAAYDVIYGGLWHCPVCRYPVPARRETCSQQGCAGRTRLEGTAARLSASGEHQAGSRSGC